jgi:hypothetical protein
MARMVVGAVFGVVVGMIAGAALELHAEDDDVAVAAAEHSIDEVLLRGAVNTTQLAPRAYLCMTGEGPCPEPPRPLLNLAVERRLDCIQHFESRGVAGAINRSSGASGLFQFLPSTWRTTPQGKAGLSVFDPVAAREAARWMIGQGRIREWAVVTQGLC